MYGTERCSREWFEFFMRFSYYGCVVAIHKYNISLAMSGKKIGDLWNWFILSVIKERLFKINLLMEHPSALAEAGVDWDETFDGEPWNGSAVLWWSERVILMLPFEIHHCIKFVFFPLIAVRDNRRTHTHENPIEFVSLTGAFKFILHFSSGSSFDVCVAYFESRNHRHGNTLHTKSIDRIFEFDEKMARNKNLCIQWILWNVLNLGWM